MTHARPAPGWGRASCGVCAVGSAAGVDRFVEFGGKVLGPMVKRTAPDVAVASVVTMDDIEALAKTI